MEEQEGRNRFLRPKKKKNEQAGGTKSLCSTLKKKDERAGDMKRK
jgi:hypothetical protein